MMWTLESVDPKDAGLTFRILPGSIRTMGRAKRSDFIVENFLLSRAHCRFTLSTSNELLVEDLDSTNGTFVNGKKVQRLKLASGDRVKVGRVEFEVNSVGESRDLVR
jgi:pSer/pThr/pTyr-binding forkhead associated (FHA) protein